MKRTHKHRLTRRRHLPFSWARTTKKRNPVQTFQFLQYTWNIDKAMELIQVRRKKDKNISQIDVDSTYDSMRWISSEITQFGGRIVDHDYAMAKTDLTKPLIFGLFRDQQTKKWYSILIDGHHRLYRAKRDRVASLPAYFLNKRENHASMLAPWKFPTKKRFLKRKRRQR